MLFNFYFVYKFKNKFSEKCLHISKSKNKVIIKNSTKLSKPFYLELPSETISKTFIEINI